MNGHNQRLYKKEKLCSLSAIGALFGPGGDARATLCYPLRMVWRPNATRRCDAPVQFMITVPKKRLRHAVDRVLMRRRIREAYRLGRDGVTLPQGFRADVAFVYTGQGTLPYSAVSRAMDRLLRRLARDAQEIVPALPPTTASADNAPA